MFGSPSGLELPLLARCCTRIAGFPRETALEVNGVTAAALGGACASSKAQRSGCDRLNATVFGHGDCLEAGSAA